MVGADLPLAQPRLELVRDALDQAAGAHEDQGAAVPGGQLDDPVVDLAPHLVAGDRAEGLAGHLDGEVPVPPVADVHDGAVGGAVRIAPAGADQQTGDVLDGPLGGGEPDALPF